MQRGCQERSVVCQRLTTSTTVFHGLSHARGCASLSCGAAAIINFLPEIMTDRERPYVFKWMEDTMGEVRSTTARPVLRVANIGSTRIQDNALFSSYIQVLPNLVLLHPELQSRAIDQVTEKLDSIAVGDIPAVVRFLIDSGSTPEVADEVVAKLRTRLHCKPGLEPFAASDRKGKTSASAAASADARLIEALRTGLMVQPIVGAAFLTRIQAAILPAGKKKKSGKRTDDDDDEDMDDDMSAGARILDVWVLLVLRSLAGTPAARADIEDLIRKGFDAAAWPEELLQNAITTRGDALTEMLPSLLAIAGALLRGAPSTAKGARGRPSTTSKPPTDAAAAGGALIYRLAWEAFRSNSKRQDILAAIASHAAGTSIECTAAFRALRDIAAKDPHGMLVFRSYLIGLLDAVDRVDEESARHLFELMAHLAAAECAAQLQHASPNADPDDGMRELHVMLRKQLNHTFPKFRRLGILGTAAYTIRLASAPGDGPRLAIAACKTALQAATDRGCCSVETLLMDELAASAASLLTGNDGQVAAWLEAHATVMLSACVVSYHSATQASARQSQSLLQELWPCLNADPDSSIAVKIADSAVALPYSRVARWTHDGDGPGMEGGRLCALLRMTAALKGSVSSIGGTLGAPLRMPPVQNVFTRSLGHAPAESSLPALVVAASWLRELLNVFSQPLSQAQRAGDVDSRLFQRLRSLVALEALIESCLEAYPGALAVVPHLGRAYGRENDAPSVGAGKKKSKAGAASGEGSKRKAAASSGGAKKKRKPSKKLDLDADGDEDGDDDGSAGEDADEEPAPAPAVMEEPPAAEEAPPPTAPRGWRAQLLRPLSLSALTCLAIPDDVAVALMPCDEPLPAGAAALPGAALLLHELATCAARAMPATAKFKGRAAGTVAVASSRDVASAEEVAEICASLMPHIQRHMHSALSILVAVKTANDEAKAAGTTPDAFPALAAPEGEPSPVTACVNDAFKAAQAVHSSVCALLRTLFSWPQLVLPANASLLRAVLRALAKPADRQGSTHHATVSSDDIGDLLPDAFTFLNDSFVAANVSTFTASMDGIRLLDAVCTTASALAEQPEHSELEVQPLRQVLSCSATDVLALDFWLEPGATGGGSERTKALKYLLTLQVQHAEDPLAELTQLAENLLPAVAELKKQKRAHVEDHPSLTPKTVTVWYGVTWTEAVRQLAAWARGSSLKTVTQSPNQIESALQDGKVLAKQVSLLATLVKDYPGNNSLLTAAVRFGGKAVRALLRAGPLFEAALKFDRTRPVLSAFFRDVQTSTRLLHGQCTEAIQRNVAASAVPASKRDLEHFLLVVTAAVDAGGQTISVAQLKHKAIDGRELPSQLVPDASDYSTADDESEDEDEDDGDEDEEPQDTQARQAQYKLDRKKAAAAEAAQKESKKSALQAAKDAAEKRKGGNAGPSGSKAAAAAAAAARRMSAVFTADDDAEDEEEEDEEEDEIEED